MSVFVSGKRHVMHAGERMTSSEMGKVFLEPLQFAVSQDTWDTGALSVGSHPSGGSQTVNNIPYTTNYEVTQTSGVDSPRRVVTTVKWTEN